MSVVAGKSSGVALTDGREEWGKEPRCDAFAPLNFNPGDVIISQKLEDVLGDLVCDVDRGRTRIDGYPDDDRTETPILSIGDSPEAGGIDRVVPLYSSVDQLINFRTKDVPNPVERRVMHWAGELGRRVRNGTAGRRPPGTVLPACVVK